MTAVVTSGRQSRAIDLDTAITKAKQSAAKWEKITDFANRLFTVTGFLFAVTGASAGGVLMGTPSAVLLSHVVVVQGIAMSLPVFLFLIVVVGVGAGLAIVFAAPSSSKAEIAQRFESNNAGQEKFQALKKSYLWNYVDSQTKARLEGEYKKSGSHAR